MANASPIRTDRIVRAARPARYLLRYLFRIPLASWLGAAVFFVCSNNGCPASGDSDGGAALPAAAGGVPQHWAFRPVADPALPPVQDRAWPRTGVDRFILATIEANGLRPSSPASRRALLRRATFDLTGLPPAVEELEAFVADQAPDAFGRAVDRLLASPRYGERWGRHWLDVARYADSNGMDENLAYANAWRYRDYVIDAFNRDRAYDRFVREQLPGDLLPGAWTGRAGFAQVVATGFLCIGPKMLAEDDPVKMELDIVDEQLDTTCRVFMGLTVGCGRCHDHKYDPVPTTDYYAMAGMFKSTRTMENFKVVARWQERPLGTPAELEKLAGHRRRVAAVTNRLAELSRVGDSNLVQNARDRAADYLLAAHDQRMREAWVKTARPLGDAVRAQGGGDCLVVEAEDFQRAENIVGTHTGYGEGIGVIYGQGGKPNWAEYDVPLAQAGYYRIEVRYAAAVARPVRLLLNRSVANPEVARGTTGSWNPDTQTWEVAGVFELPRGTNVVRVERDDCIPHLDKLLLAAVPADEAKRWVAGQGPAAARSGLVPEFVRQWAAALEKSSAETNSVLAPWHELGRGAPMDGATAEPPLQGTLPTTPAELALRHGALFREADQAWRELRALRTNPPPERLPDPALEPFRRLLHDPKGPFALPKNAESYYEPDLVRRLSQTRAELKQLEQSGATLPEAMAVSEGAVQDLRVHKRGSHLALGEAAPRGFLGAIGGPRGRAPGTNVSGRLELADWLVDPEHPLTARVMVNRIWLWHFGEGLVRSPDNFGKLGETPTHPELLDWLARRFMESGWSIKAMHRLIMASSVYQQSTGEPAQSQPKEPALSQSKGTVADVTDLASRGAVASQLASDPENKLWARFNRRRLDAEAVRDSILALSGRLELGMGGPVLSVRDREYVTGTASKLEVSIYDSRKRSVYLPVVRSALYELFQAFDFADPSTLCGRRDQTTVAPQALFMLNSRLVAESARTLARSLLAEPERGDDQRLSRLYQRAYGRSPTQLELVSALRHLEGYQARRESGGLPGGEAREAAWQSLCRAAIAANEFIYLE